MRSMAYVAKVVKSFSLEFHEGEILPVELTRYLTATGKLADLVNTEAIVIGRES
jgi:hypothetical protein